MLAICLSCRGALEGAEVCPGCDRPHPVEDGILISGNPPTGRNRVAAEFYDGPGWSRFRPIERFFLTCQGGQESARGEILRWLPSEGGLKVLEVGIGDGDNLPFLPKSWEVHGADISKAQLAGCLQRFPEMSGRLTWAEAEELPFPDSTFDAVFSVGGFNYYRDPARAFSEMRRVARPGATILAADEIPGLRRFTLGHLIGAPFLDYASLRLAGLDRDFARMVLSRRFDPEGFARRYLPRGRLVRVWSRLGYCLIDPGPGRTMR